MAVFLTYKNIINLRSLTKTDTHYIAKPIKIIASMAGNNHKESLTKLPMKPCSKSSKKKNNFSLNISKIIPFHKHLVHKKQEN